MSITKFFKTIIKKNNNTHKNSFEKQECMEITMMIKKMAPRDGFGPPTRWLTASCSTAELSRNAVYIFISNIGKSPVLFSQKNIFFIKNKIANDNRMKKRGNFHSLIFQTFNE